MPQLLQLKRSAFTSNRPFIDLGNDLCDGQECAMGTFAKTTAASGVPGSGKPEDSAAQLLAQPVQGLTINVREIRNRIF